MALHGVEPHPALAEAMTTFGSELERLRQEHMAEQVKRQREKARRRKK
jgi:hypothetical protein